MMRNTQITRRLFSNFTNDSWYQNLKKIILDEVEQKQENQKRMILSEMKVREERRKIENQLYWSKLALDGFIGISFLGTAGLIGYILSDVGHTQKESNKYAEKIKQQIESKKEEEQMKELQERLEERIQKYIRNIVQEKNIKE